MAMTAIGPVRTAVTAPKSSYADSKPPEDGILDGMIYGAMAGAIPGLGISGAFLEAGATRVGGIAGFAAGVIGGALLFGVWDSAVKDSEPEMFDKYLAF